MKKCTIILKDFVNVKLEGLPQELRQKIHKLLKFMVPYARHTPQFKLKRWDGKVPFATLGGNTYINLLDKVIPIIVEAGYEIEIDDQRQHKNFDFKEIDENFLADYTWNKDHIYGGEPIILMDHQVNAVNAYLKNHQSLISAATSAGKCQPLFSKIKTPTGWTTFANIKINDKVLTPTGHTATVTDLFDPGEKDVYQIVFNDGRMTHCCEDHLWKVNNEIELLTTKEIITKLESGKKVSIPLPTMVNDTNHSDVPIDPMLMGAIIANGNFYEYINLPNTRLTKKNIKKLDLPHHKIKEKNNTIYITNKKLNCHGHYAGALVYGLDIVIDSTHFDNFLRYYGVADFNIFNSYIPEIYKNGSYQQRISFLRGFFGDHDVKNINNKTIRVGSYSKKLINDLIYMIRSVGGFARYSQKTKNKKHPYHFMEFNHPNNSSLVYIKTKIQKPELFISKITKIRKMPVRCIMIDDPDHLYITDDFIVTHNTIITSCCSKIIEQTSGGRTITIVPSITLVRQTEVDYLNVGLDTGVYFGEEKNYDNQHILTTWQSMVSLSKSAKENIEARDRLNRLLYNVDMVMVDECHTIKGQELKELLCADMAHIPIRWGLTGTIPKDDFSMACLNSSIGNVVYSITAKELQDKGIISNCHIDIMRLVDDSEFSSYEDEKNYIISDKERTDWLINFCEELSKKGNTLVLVDSIDLGKKLSKMVPNSFFIYGLIHNDKRLAEFKKMASSNNLLLFASFQTSSTGISAVRIFNIILVSAGRSFTRCIQSIGRGLRKGGDKDFINIYDITSTLKFESSQLRTRKSYYKEAQYPFTEHKIKYK